jgi:hypothetical protein
MRNLEGKRVRHGVRSRGAAPPGNVVWTELPRGERRDCSLAYRKGPWLIRPCVPLLSQLSAGRMHTPIDNLRGPVNLGTNQGGRLPLHPFPRVCPAMRHGCGGSRKTTGFPTNNGSVPQEVTRGPSRPGWVLAMILWFVMPAHAATEQDTTPVLRPNPEVAAVLASLEGGQATYLPPADVRGNFNEEARRHGLHESGPRGRNFCVKAVWAPDRQRALFAGANAGVPHRLNDVWEYDLAANTWYLLYPPDPSMLRGNEEAFEAVREPRRHTIVDNAGSSETVTLIHTNRGGPGEVSHTWWGLVYDPVRRVMMWNIIYANRGGTYEGPPVWAFDPHAREWTPVLFPHPRPTRTGLMAFEHIPELGGVVWYNATWSGPGMWLHPSDEYRLVDLAPNDGVNPRRCPDCPGHRAVMTYDADARVLIAVSGTRTYHYDVEKNRWSLVVDAPDGSDDVPYGHFARVVFGYEPAAGAALLYSRETPDSVWVYHTNRRQWKRQSVTGPEGPTHSQIIGYVDPARNVLVVNDRRDVWVYRHTPSR